MSASDLLAMRLEAICRLIERRAPDGDDRVLLDEEVADLLAADIRALLAPTQTKDKTNEG